MKLNEMPFRRRVGVGVGFWLVGIAGISGSVMEALAAADASGERSRAINRNDTVAVQHWEEQHDHRTEDVFVNLGTGALSLAAGWRLGKGSWAQLLRYDGDWADTSSDPGPAIPIRPQTVLERTSRTIRVSHPIPQIPSQTA